MADERYGKAQRLDDSGRRFGAINQQQSLGAFRDPSHAAFVKALRDHIADSPLNNATGQFEIGVCQLVIVHHVEPLAHVIDDALQALLFALGQLPLKTRVQRINDLLNLAFI